MQLLAVLPYFLLDQELGVKRVHARAVVYSGTRSLTGPRERLGTWRSEVSLRLDKANAGTGLAVWRQTHHGSVQVSRTPHGAVHIPFESQEHAGITLHIY